MEAIYDEIYDAHLPCISIGEIDVPVLIVFSAIPGSGKSALTERLTDNYGFTRFANKDIRKSINQTGHENDAVIGDYTIWLLNKLTKPKPRAIVFDRNIDQCYIPVMDWAEVNKYKLVLVRIEVSYKNLEKRLRKREGANAAKVLDVLDFYKVQHERIVQHFQEDLLLEEDYNLENAAHKIVDIAMR